MLPAFALVVGHSRGDEGARSVDGTGEYSWNLEHVPRVRDELARLGVEAVIVLRDEGRGGYSKLPAKINRTRAAACVSFHWNAHGNPAANGSEVLYLQGSSRGLALARALDLADDVLELRERGAGGVVGISSGGRGYPLLYRTAMPCAIVEPAFGTNAADWQRMNERREALAVAQAAALAAWTGGRA